jgi:hypothetical protein
MNPNELKIGHVYFSCGWSNRKYPVPVIGTYVYIGKNLYEDREDKSQDEFVFESPLKYFENDILNGLSEDDKEEYDGPEDPTQMVISEDSLVIIKDIDGLIDFIERTKKEPNAEDIF